MLKKYSFKFRLQRIEWKILFLIFLSFLLYNFDSNAQTKGFIFESGSVVMDPNGDGYVSQSSSGFSGDNYDVDEFEIKMFPLPTLGEGEKLEDINTGPRCGFTDMATDTAGAATYASLSGGNLIFRFRLANYKPNAKGYTVFIDTDSLIGVDDPNYTTENPGFEIAIVLRSKTDVFIADIDGVNGCGDIKASYPISTYHQKSIAGIESCDNADYFYDFYVPFADLTTHFGVTASTGLRFVSTTTTANACALGVTASDVGGLDDQAFGGCIPCAWETIINVQVPTPVDSLCDTCGGFAPVRTNCPSISGTINSRFLKKEKRSSLSLFLQ